MRIGVPKEIKAREYRVGLTPAGVRELVGEGHEVLVEAGAGEAIGLEDAHYRDAGARILDNAAAVYAEATLIVKVKEPLARERALLRDDHILFAYLHLAPDPEQTRELLDSGVAAIAYETVTDTRGGLPLLAPMSEVAGRMAIQAAAHCLEKASGGSGVLLGGVPGVEPGRVLVIGGGVVGLSAARMAAGLGAQVRVLDRDLARLRHIDDLFGPRLVTLHASTEVLEQGLAWADAVVGAVLVPGAATPKLVTRQMLSLMQRGSVLVDVAVDQGGCFETSRPTTHDEPTYLVDGIVHYCVANMPGAVARTATFALTNATLPDARALSRHVLHQSLSRDAGLLAGLNVYRGQLTCAGVAEAQGQDYTPPEQVLRG